MFSVNQSTAKPPNLVKVTPYFSIPEADVDDFTAHIQHLARSAFQRQGTAAFECPKSAACAHEAGHCVVHAAEGDDVLGASVFRRTERGQTGWLGETRTNTALLSGPGIDPETELKAARCMIAGVAAEQAFEGKHFRFGSSLDEVVAFTRITANAAMKLGRDQVQVRVETFETVGRTLADNWPVVLAIAAALDERRRLNSRRLSRLLAHVRKPADTGRLT